VLRIPENEMSVVPQVPSVQTAAKVAVPTAPVWDGQAKTHPGPGDLLDRCLPDGRWVVAWVAYHDEETTQALVAYPVRRAKGADMVDANPIVHCSTNSLFAAEITLCSLYRNVPKKELDLLQLTACRMAQLRA
jgi:hypothetical protein